MSAIQISTASDLQQIGGLMAKSGFFSDIKSEAQAAVKVLAGQELGFGAFASMAGIHVIGGKPAVGAGLMAAAIKGSRRYGYEVLEHTDKVCKIAFYEVEVKADLLALKRRLAKGEITKAEYFDTVAILSMGISEFTIEKAQSAKVWNAKKSAFVPLTENNPNWKAYPENMLFARAISNGFRWYCQDITGAPVYTPEELGAQTDADGEPIDVASVTVVEPPHPEATVGSDETLRKRYFAELTAAGVDDVGKATLKAIVGVESNNDLTRSQVDAILRNLAPEKVATLNSGVNPKTGEVLVQLPTVAA